MNESNLRYNLLQHIEDISLSSSHAKCIEEVLRDHILETKFLNEISKENLKKSKDSKLFIFLPSDEKLNLKNLELSFQTTVFLYSLSNISSDVIAWFKKLFEIYLYKSLRYHVSKDTKPDLIDLATLILSELLPDISLSKNYLMNQTWKIYKEKPLLSRLIECAYVLFDQHVNKQTLLVNLTQSKLAILCDLIEKTKENFDENPLTDWYWRLRLIFEILRQLNLPPEPKKKLVDLAVYTCKKLK